MHLCIYIYIYIHTYIQVIEDLEALFNAFDEDHSGELDEGEVGRNDCVHVCICADMYLRM
jgi:hypothetical protein